jgi:pimeloyl-ACP methyl ester carboxylesterase
VEGALGYYWSFRKEAFGTAAAAWRRQFQAPTAVPTLAMFGETDGALDHRGLEGTRALFTGPYELVRVPGAGHFVHREAEALFVEKTLAFLTAQAARAGSAR